MVWLVTHIWMFIGLAALLGLILGWAVRGIRVSGSSRRAIVERNIALTELDQVRAELDGLYTAQRAQGQDGQMQEELRARDARLGELEAALVAAREQVETVKAEGEKKLLAAAAASAAVAGAGAVAVGSRHDDQTSGERLDAAVNKGDAQLEWRNRYLESRVRSLESVSEASDKVKEVDAPIVEDMSERVTELETGNQTLQTRIEELEAELTDAQSRTESPVGAVAGAVAGAGAVLAIQDSASQQPAPEPSVDTIEQEKLAWQNSYLRQRLAFMEEHGLSDAETTTTGADPDVVSDGPPVAEVVATAAATAPSADEQITETAADAGDIEQELARLRWRNRYLEGRLAYIDGDATSDQDVGEDADEAKQNAAEALLERLERSDTGDD